MSTRGTPSFELSRNGSPDHLLLKGELSLRAGDDLFHELARLAPDLAGKITVDLSQLEELEGGGAALLLELRARRRVRGGEIVFTGTDEKTERLLEVYGCPNSAVLGRAAPTRIGMLDHIGRATLQVVAALRGILNFTGDLAASSFQALRQPRTIFWSDVPRLAERAGADGAPIVLLVNFLVGFIMALQSAAQLERFGAELFVADLVGLAMIRELAPLMAAIIVAGRSGAAFAAELASMRVSEEVDALKTIGLDPQGYLVVPRILALFLVLPLLTVLSDLVGCIGGLVVAVTSLDLAPEVYLRGLRAAIDLSDVAVGVIKSFAFALAIALISCQRGLAARGGATAVGEATTSSIVSILLSLILLDVGFTSLFAALEI